MRRVLICALVLAVFAAAQPVIPFAASAASSDPLSPKGLDVAKAVKTPRALPVAPEGRFAQDGGRPPEPKKVRERVEERSATSEVWDNDDGSRSVVQHAAPKFYKADPAAGFQPIDTALAPTPGRPGWAHSKATAMGISFAPLGTPGGNVQIAVGGATVGFSPVGATAVAVQPSVEGSRATYGEVWPGVDAAYEVSAQGVEEVLVVKGPGSAATFGFDLVGMTAKAKGDGGLDLSVDGRRVGIVPAPTVTAAGRAVPGEVSGAVFGVEADASGRAGGRVRVSVDAKWLASLPAREFPVAIDPTFYDEVPSSSVVSMPNYGQSVGNVQVGVDAGFRDWRAEALFPLPPPVANNTNPSRPWQLIRATMFLRGSVTDGVKVFGDPPSVGSYWYVDRGSYLFTAGANGSGDITSWVRNRQGPSWYGFKSWSDETNPSSNPLKVLNPSILYHYAQASPPTTVSSPTDGQTISTLTPTLTANPSTETNPFVFYDFKVGTSPDGRGTVLDSGWLTVMPGGCNTPGPCTTTPVWAVPPGALSDGMTYYATVLANTDPPGVAGAPPPAAPGPAVKFTVKQRLGAGGPSPTDTVGSPPGTTDTPSKGAPSPGTPPASVTVNMVTGNLALGAGTRSLQSLAGAASVSLQYNSGQPDSVTGGQHGLNGEYFVDDGSHDPARAQPAGRRLDPAVSFDWSNESPMGGFRGGAPVLARWTGTITVPATVGDQRANWVMGGLAPNGGGVMVKVDGQTAYDNWPGNASTSVASFGSVDSVVSPGVSHQIEVSFWSRGGSASVQLWARNLSPPPKQADATIVPTTWLAPRATGLPGGWKLSGDTFGGGWERAVDQGSQVVVQSASGDTASFTRRGDGSYQAPPGNNDALSVIAGGAGTGQLQLSTTANYTYVFNRDGTLASVTSVADDRQPAALAYGYTGVPAVLTSITDPVSSRVISLAYAGNGSCPAQAAAPLGMLCAIRFWDGTTTLVRYNSNGQLAQMINTWGLPGATVSYFGYDITGRLSAILDPLGWDATATGTVRTVPLACDPANAASDCDVMTQIAYDYSGRVASVTQPAPTAGAPRPRRSYSYATGLRFTNAFIAGFSPASGYASRVYYDAKSRITLRRDSSGLAASTVWDALDRPMVSVDTAGLETSTFYDAAGNVTDTYGPAPTACFTPSPPPDAPANTAVPVANPQGTPGCATAVPRTRNRYDEGLTSLAASFWPNPDFAGPATVHSTGPGGTGPSGPGCPAGTLCTQWNTPPVAPNGRTTPEGFTWSLRMTGTVTLPPGTSTFIAWTSQRVAVYIDDNPILLTDATDISDGWNPYGTFDGGYPSAPVTGGTHRIRIDSWGSSTSPNAVGLQSGPNQYQTPFMPNTALNPAYGLRTSVTDPDDKLATTAYTDASIGAELGLVTATTLDPTGLNLRTTTAREAPGVGRYLRRQATTLPAGGTTTYTSYCGQPSGPGCATPQIPGAVASACGVTAGAAQSGLLAQQTDPDPDGTGPVSPRAQQFLYDPAGRQVGRRVGPAGTIGSAPWACTAYDLRGRVTSHYWPATTTAPARTVGYTYGVGGNPLVSSVADPAGTVRSIVDLLGRVTTYTDVWDKTTTVAYDQAGRATTTAGPQGVITQAYDPNTSKPSTLTRNGTVLASAGFSGDRLATVVYANGTGLSVGYDLLGRQNSLSFTGGAGRLVASEVTTSLGGRRNNQLIDTAGPGLVDPNPAGDDFVYDGAGRLTAAYLNGARADYGYNTNLPAEGCANPAMGADTNRTSVTVTPTAGPATVTRACYDKADRLVSTSAGGGPVSTAYAYDGHGNATTDAATTLSYDAADRLTGVASATTTVSYVRDALDRVVSRTEGATVTRYAHGGFSDAPVAILDSTSVPLQIPLALPGGATLTVQATGDIWSYPDLAGHLVATANSTGARQGPPVTYDPWGAEYPARPPIDNANGNADFGAFGAASKLEEHATPSPIVLMGARPYSPTEARFLSVDPVQGGCANNYTYVHGDPVNTSDTSGRATSDFAQGPCGTAFLSLSRSSDGNIQIDYGFVLSNFRATGYGVIVAFSSSDGYLDVSGSSGGLWFRKEWSGSTLIELNDEALQDVGSIMGDLTFSVTVEIFAAIPLAPFGACWSELLRADITI